MMLRVAPTVHAAAMKAAARAMVTQGHQVHGPLTLAERLARFDPARHAGEAMAVPGRLGRER